jgi:hypothetical protein
LSALSMCSVVSFWIGSTATVGRFSCIQRWTTADLRIVCMFSFIICCKSLRSRPVLIAAWSRPGSSLPRTARGPLLQAASSAPAHASKAAARLFFIVELGILDVLSESGATTAVVIGGGRLVDKWTGGAPLNRDLDLS